MTDSKSRPADLEDLSVRARRDSLSDAERRSFEHALAGSATLQVAHQVGRDFDRAAAVLPGDDELIARVVDSVAGAPRKLAARKRGLKFTIALAATLAATSAGAALWSARTEPRASTTSPQGPADLQAAKPTAKNGVPDHERTADPAPPNDSDRPRREEHSAPATTGSHHSAVVPSEMVSAKTLFRDANAARRDGDFGRAIARYTELERKFPDSEESRLSHVSVGKLLLGSGKAAEAERHFARYLNSGGGALAEEALVGRAQSLRGLGRAEEERRVLRELLGRFPASVYAARARQQLAEADP